MWMKKRTLIISVCIVSPMAQWLFDLFAGHSKVSDFEYPPDGSFVKAPTLSTCATVREIVLAGSSVIIGLRSGRSSVAEHAESAVYALDSDVSEVDVKCASCGGLSKREVPIDDSYVRSWL